MPCHRSWHWLIAATLLAAMRVIAADKITPPVIIQTREAQFPHALSLTPVYRGTAEVIINIDADGQLVDLLVSRYSRIEFAHEAETTLREWRYQPARRDGEPTGARFLVKFDFSARGKVATLTVFDTLESRIDLLHPGALTDVVCASRDLDRPLKPVTTVPPHHPGQLPNADRDATVMIDYLIDETGRPRMPVVLQATRDGFAVEVVDALSQWRFAPPTRAGRPVAVQVRQQFVFKQDI
jgi:outer membrane biosynthesis protein TonB